MATTNPNLGDGYRIVLPSCPSLSMAGVKSKDCFRGSCYYECDAGFTVTNPAGTRPVTCELAGYYSGHTPVCRAELAQPPTDITATISGQTATVTWKPPTDFGTYTSASHYAVRAAGTFVGSDFEGITSLPAGWAYSDYGQTLNKLSFV